MDNEGSRPRTRASAARAAAAAAAISARTRSSAARATTAAESPAARRSSRRATRAAARAPATSSRRRYHATPPSMGGPPAPPETSAADSAASHLSAAPRRRELTFSHPQTPSASRDRQDNIESDGLKTPTPTINSAGGDCAVCLSPLKKGNRQQQQQQQEEIYTVHACGHTFHRACLVESRRAGNTGCPCCRGELERGLTPEPTAAENRAAAALSAARTGALDSAVTAMESVRELLGAVADASPFGKRAAAAQATLAAAATQAAVAGVLSVVRSPAPTLAMYETVSSVLLATRARLRKTRLVLTVAETQEAREEAEEAVAEAERKVRQTRLAARTAASVDPGGARSLGFESPREALAAALLEAETAKASLARRASRESTATQELLAAAEAVERLRDGGGGGIGGL